MRVATPLAEPVVIQEEFGVEEKARRGFVGRLS